MQHYWPLVLEHLKTRISTSTFQAWFSRVKFINVINQGRKIVLGVPSNFNKHYIEGKFQKELREAINKYYPKVIHTEIKIIELPKSQQKPIQDSLNLKKNEEKDSPSLDKPEDVKHISSYLPRRNLNNLNPKYTFDNFVVTRSNEFITNVAQGVIEELGTLYNPLFIHSPVGLGKTHLLQAIGHKVLEKDPSLNIKYLPSETFFNQFYLALKKKEMEEFRQYYRDVDLLLIDDIQFITGKDAFQTVFFHVFNELHQMNKQIIITSDKPAKELIGVEERLVSRFEWGMVADMPKPDKEDRLTILKDKIERMKLILTNQQIDLIATKVDTNIREMEGVLNKIKARVRLNPGHDFSDKQLITILKPYQNKNEFNTNRKAKTPDSIMDTICHLFSLKKTDLLGSGRQKNLSLARQLTFWFYKNELDLSYPSIGKMIGGRDHTTVMHGSKKIDKLIKDEDERVLEKIKLTREILQKN